MQTPAMGMGSSDFITPVKPRRGGRASVQLTKKRGRKFERAQ
jgi:hypothetical protein